MQQNQDESEKEFGESMRVAMNSLETACKNMQIALKPFVDAIYQWQLDAQRQSKLFAEAMRRIEIPDEDSGRPKE